jgi:N6-adenosine-specific RNA methylase IME4
MAWLETCQIDARKQIDHRKESLGGVRPAIRQLSKESGIPQGTLKRWYYPENKCPKNGTHDSENSGVPLETCAVSDLQHLIDSGRKFGAILCDPPWQYSNQATRASTSNHYNTMATEEIVRLPISELAAEQSHLHLWTTNAFLFECPKILEAWEFEYKGVFVWIKNQMGIGNYWRVSHEFMVLGIRGDLRFRDHSQMSWIMTDRTTHSTKPDSVADKIEKVSPGPYLELFGRRTRPNWTVWGDQITRTLFNESAFETNLHD